MKSILLGLAVLLEINPKNLSAMNALQKASLPLLGLVLLLGVLQYTHVIDLFGETAPPPETAAEEIYNGELYRQVAAFQAAEKGLYELEKALKAVEAGKQEVSLSAAGIKSISRALQELGEANNRAILTRFRCPPFCPPSPCDRGDPLGFINCMPANFQREALSRFELFRIEGRRQVQLLDANGKVVVEAKEQDLDKNSMAYFLDIPKKFTAGTLVITEQVGKQRSVSKMDVRLE